MFWQFGSMITVPFVMSSLLAVKDTFVILLALVQGGRDLSNNARMSTFQSRRLQKMAKSMYT